MRIGIITLSCALNYGAMLQSFALYKYIKTIGHEPVIIDYITERYNFDSPNYPEEFIKRTKVWKINRFMGYIWKKTKYQDLKKAKETFWSFLHEQCVFTHSYFSNDELVNDIPICDFYITGSDQVWNPDFLWNGYVDLPYYLSFVNDDNRKISYASSFGKNSLSVIENEQASMYLKKYKAISVREESGKQIVEKMGKDATVVCDPTVLCDEKNWFELSSKINRKPYLLLFLIRWNSKIYKKAKRLAHKRKIDFIYISPSLNDKRRFDANTKSIPSVYEWLGYIKNADYVLTDSFHGTVFSTIFEKKFLSITGEYSSRIQTYLRIIGLIERSINYQLDNIEIIYNEIDYYTVNRLRKNYQQESREWLNDALNAI